MRRPRHAAEESSSGRSAGMAPGRGAALLAVAVVLGVVLLNAADDGAGERVAAGGEDDETPASTTTTTAPLTTVPTTPLRAPKDVKVLSANGTTVKGVARKVTDQLKGAGYNVLAPTDSQRPAQASAVYFLGDFQREAQAAAASLGLPASSVLALPTPPPVADARGANVVVVVGPDLAQRLSAANPATTTTAAATGSSASTAPAAGVTTTTKP